jgi:sulfatase-like protein
LHVPAIYRRFLMGRIRLWYPFFFAVLPILNILTRNPGGSRPADVGVVLGALLLGCAVLYLLVAVVLGGRWSNPVVPLVVLVVLFLFNAKYTLGGWARQLGGGAATIALLAVPLVLISAGVWWLARRPRYLEQVNTFLTLTSGLMLAWLGFRLASDQIHSQSVVRHSVLARELAQPIKSRTATPAAAPGPARDIYLILLDEYANSSVLQERFQFNNHVFEDSLRQLGFTIPKSVRSNYVHTLLSLPSLLNFSHLTRLTSEVGPRATDATLPNYLLENNRVAAFLKGRGYRFLFFPSQWWPSTEHNRNADWEFQAWSGFNLGREATRSDLRRSFLRTTALGLFKKDDAWDADHVTRTLAGIEQVPERAEPTFVFAHIVSPHTPYVFTADCHTVGARAPGGRPRGQPYIDQLQCLNHLVLKLVTTLLQRSSVAPIILLQGDHGTNSLRYSDAKSARDVSPAQARERFGAFGAYYLPGGGGRLFADSVTIVNVFQKVLDYYFNADIPPAPDQLYMSMERTPYDFVQVDPAALNGPAVQVSAGADR